MIQAVQQVIYVNIMHLPSLEIMISTFYDFWG